jgi:dTDP-glucose 4,6-dehydratase
MGKYIIFGGDGFLGRWLAEKLLKNGGSVVICDVEKSDLKIYDKAEYVKVDITKPEEIKKVSFNEDDTVIHLAARQYHLKVPRTGRRKYFFDVNFQGTANLLVEMERQKCRKMVYFSTDMTYGKPMYLPVDTKHQQKPFGPYGESKKASEDLCRQYREKGFKITIFRPRMILGPGRLGILKKLFKLIENSLPVPMIGNGQNCYQMISVFDCVAAVEKAIEKGMPNREYNLGSENPPTVESLLRSVIKSSNSKSALIKTNGRLVKRTLEFMAKIGLEIMYREQYEIADENYIVDIENTKKELGWESRYTDSDMLYEAYEYYKGEKK